MPVTLLILLWFVQQKSPVTLLEALLFMGISGPVCAGL
jgi:hypothetical protein